MIAPLLITAEKESLEDIMLEARKEIGGRLLRK